MKSTITLIVFSFLVATSVSHGDDLPVSLDATSSVEVLDPSEMGGDTTGEFVSREEGVAKGTVGNGKPRTAQFRRFYRLVAAPIIPAPAECLDKGVAFLGRIVLRNEITLVFDDLSAVSAKQDGGFVCLDVTPGNPSIVNAVWFSSPLDIQGGTGKYQGATGQLELLVDIGAGNLDTGESGAYVGSSSISGTISTP